MPFVMELCDKRQQMHRSKMQKDSERCSIFNKILTRAWSRVIADMYLACGGSFTWLLFGCWAVEHHSFIGMEIMKVICHQCKSCARKVRLAL